MKKILLLFSICLISMLGYAQTNEDGKESVYIDYFSRPGSINNILAEALRNKAQRKKLRRALYRRILKDPSVSEA